MAETVLRLDIITPEKLVVSEEVNWVLAPGESGEFQVLAEHTPYLTALQVGLVTYDQDGTQYYLSVSGGFCEVMPDRVLILAHTAERAEAIDLVRATAARDRAMNRLSGKGGIPIDEARARLSLQRALNRLNAREMQ